MSDVIHTEHLSMRFRRSEALRDVSLNVSPGTVFALLGENGAGKTTLIRILTGFQKPTDGQAQVLGCDPTRDAMEIRRRSGYVSDAPALYPWMTVAEIGWFTASFYPSGFQQRYRDLVHQFGVPLDQKIKHLSKGQRAKVALSLALAHSPELLILDEPTSGLDPKVRRDFMESMIDMAASGRTLFLSSHQINEVERVADVIAIMHRGELILVSPLSELKESVWEFTVSLSDAHTKLPPPTSQASVLSQQIIDRQVRLMIRDADPEFQATLAATPGVNHVAQRRPSLEEIFIAVTAGSHSTQEAK